MLSSPFALEFGMETKQYPNFLVYYHNILTVVSCFTCREGFMDGKGTHKEKMQEMAQLWRVCNI